jgi:DHA1 family bicyclomycin/chloramphenicol resistance-like MFS transporter
LLGCTFFYLGSQGFVFPNTSALALNPFAKLAGSASAMLGTIQLSIGALASASVSFFHNNTALPMVVIMALCSFLSFLFLMILAPRLSSNTSLKVKI